jgi:putative phosphoribosyl transferase
MSTAVLDRPIATTRVVRIAADGASLAAELTLPDDASGLIVFAHTSGERQSARSDRRIAAILQQQGFGTLLFDLLTPDEQMVDSRTRNLRSDLGLLSRRLIDSLDWLAIQTDTRHLPTGVFGDGAGAAAALVASCVRRPRIKAVVTNGGKPSLASPVLSRITTPTLFIAGGNDGEAIRSSEAAFHRLHSAKELVLIDDASWLLEPTDALEEAAHLAARWFARHLVANEIITE